jgi:hypothetical protein
MLISVLSPICTAGFILGLFWFSDAVVTRFRPGYRFWLDLNFSAWNLIVLPITVAVVAEMSWEQDKDANAWRHLLHQPVPKICLYFAKLANNYLLFFSSIILLFVLLPIGGAILKLNEALPMGTLEIGLLFQYFLFSLAASIPLIAFQTWFSFRFHGPAMGLGIALAGTWGAMKLIGATHLVQFLPWGLASHSVSVFERWNKLPWNYCYGATATAIIFIFLGSMDFSKHAFAKSLERN